jgi:hypothetical protein
MRNASQEPRTQIRTKPYDNIFLNDCKSFLTLASAFLQAASVGPNSAFRT